ncbi:MAG: ABC transporter permease [Ruminococcus sp.]|uniref:FtsX-like permease family protein n=1 Tax=Ruminococcus sp. TaxID=41978 RepID=UPI0025E36B6B|nr:ABC transporter permease [Ruminococcus sp.]MCR5600070.1 ABC transporter permease [Ruminococcus sp.]
MLFKISLSNIRKSIKDYAVYFFTLIIGVAVFYVFNAIETQTAFMAVTEDKREIIDVLTKAISAVSVFVAIVLGLLIVYASRFLMKRRNKEFALYMMLGMSKWRISALLLCETVIIGVGSLVVGLLIGVGLSQVMSAVVANLFEADMTNYKFMVSNASIVKTILYFGIMYIVVMLRSGFVISKCRLITLMNSGKRSEKIAMKNPWVCMIVFLLSAAVLGYAYYMVGWNQADLDEEKIVIAIAMGAVSTFFIFWSVAGMLLRVVMSAKGVYHHGLNSFTFRQISSKVNTTVASMTVICLMLFLTICTLSTAFVIRNSMNSQVEEYFPVDFCMEAENQDDNNDPLYTDIDDCFGDDKESLYNLMGDHHKFHIYTDADLTFVKSLGDKYEELKKEIPEVGWLEYRLRMVKLSDYNALMKLFGRKSIDLAENEYAVCATYNTIVNVYNKLLPKNNEITAFGNTLVPKYKKCIDSFVCPTGMADSFDTIIVPDSVINESGAGGEIIVGNYKASDKKGIESAEKALKEIWQKKMYGRESSIRGMHCLDTRQEAADNAIGVSALVTFLGLYIGFVFLVSCGAILALKELSESADSIPRYTMLRKLGVEESEITKSVFRQSGIFFLLPLLLACLHAYFGMRLGKFVLDMLVSGSFIKPMFFTAAVVVLIYGGYFLLTFLGSKAIVKEQK